MYELETRFGAIASDPVDLVRQLIRKLERTPVYTSLVSVLHNLATVYLHYPQVLFSGSNSMLDIWRQGDPVQGEMLAAH